MNPSKSDSPVVIIFPDGSNNSGGLVASHKLPDGSISVEVVGASSGGGGRRGDHTNRVLEPMPAGGGGSFTGSSRFTTPEGPHRVEIVNVRGGGAGVPGASCSGGGGGYSRTLYGSDSLEIVGGDGSATNFPKPPPLR